MQWMIIKELLDAQDLETC